jgi:hypothetical protein
MNKELSNGFVGLDSLAKLYSEAKKSQREEVVASLFEAAQAIAMANAESAYATTLAAFADEAVGGVP